MKLTGEQLIPAPVETVWQMINDPEVLRACIPGCESLERGEDDRLTATVALKVGPVKARFAGEVTLSEIDPPNGYRIFGKGSGGVAGFAEGGAVIALAPVEGGTLLSYEAEAKIGGKLAQLGTRLIDSTAKKLTLQFFDALNQRITETA
ncbi:carbon monoxide dehydrogenase [Haematobacter missouriensis]|uniref:Carbon monoxide dehydrogenase n=1 Tax=Haematobacter missouriensis TaxID=366616 RepID=A0A212ALA1_9RHOB|nr:carbon monoxide dehydrogenase subunit G [Haematobacter missouriensis]KFI32478.1 carbon monoxide dehydrogenase [Haematobacter missouriensis]OWJ76450.1 carbon monoxide dehydrogenase [Haematobacter missouriensis]OWJ82278.1 carbon monoxide dehydrogenase [Haematobacter missouriensis]